MSVSAVAIAGIIGLAAISHRLLHHYLTSQDKNQNESGCTVPAAMTFGSNGIDVLDGLSDTRTNLLHESNCDVMEAKAQISNSNAFDSLEWRKPILGEVMEALGDPHTHLIGVYGSQEEIKDTLLQRVCRRVQRDQRFGMVVTAVVTKYPDVRKIQEDIARQLGFTLKHMSKDKRANELIYTPPVLNVRPLYTLYKGLTFRTGGVGSRMSRKFSFYSVISTTNLTWVR